MKLFYIYTSNSYKIHGEKKNKLQKRYRTEYAHHINPAANTYNGSSPLMQRLKRGGRVPDFPYKMKLSGAIVSKERLKEREIQSNREQEILRARAGFNSNGFESDR